ncbi:MAG: rhodanese-like domain-containing protein [Bacteroidales bacterium]|nr:rhodanese-like domain-containing protein [Bacteroidales bacterium]
MKRLISVAVLASIISLLSCSTQQKISSQDPKPAFRNVGVEEFESLIARKNVQILDSRTQSEFDESHIKGSVLIDVNEPEFKSEALKTLDKSKKVAVYCRSGRRSRIAAQILADEGFKVTNLDGGIISWKEAGKELEQTN